MYAAAAMSFGIIRACRPYQKGRFWFIMLNVVKIQLFHLIDITSSWYQLSTIVNVSWFPIANINNKQICCFEIVNIFWPRLTAVFDLEPLEVK